MSFDNQNYIECFMELPILVFVVSELNNSIDLFTYQL